MLSAESAKMTGDRDTGIRRGLDILNCLAGQEAQALGGLGVTRLAQLLGQDKSQISRSLKVLAEYGIVERDPKTRACRLGWQLFALAQRSGDQRLLQKAGPVLDDLLGRLDESVYLSIANGLEALTVLEREPSHAIQAKGGDWPLHATSVGRVLLAGRGDAEIRALYSAVPPPGGIELLLEQVARTRADGYSVVIDEFEKGLTAVGAPVRDVGGAVVAAIGVSGPSYRFAPAAKAAVAEVVAAAKRLGDALSDARANRL